MNRKGEAFPLRAFPARLRWAMANEGLDIQALATKSGASVSGIKKWLGGVSRPRTGNLRSVAEALRVSVGWLLGETDAGGPQKEAELAEALRASMRALSEELPGPTAGQEPRSPKGPPLLTPLARPDLMDEAFREALAAVGIPAVQFGNTKKLMMLTLLLYDRRAEKEADELAAILTGAPSKLKATAS